MPALPKQQKGVQLASTAFRTSIGLLSKPKAFNSQERMEKTVPLWPTPLHWKYPKFNESEFVRRQPSSEPSSEQS